MLRLGVSFWWLLFSSVIVSASSTLTSVEDHVHAIIDWVRSKEGGFFHDALELRRYDTNHPDVGMYATQDIPKGRVLLSIPREVVLTAGDDQGDDDWGAMWCPTIWNLLSHFQQGKESPYAPYVNYLLSQPRGQLPSAWSPEGKALLRHLVGQDDPDDRYALPPSDITGWIDIDWQQGCQEGKEDDDDDSALALEHHAALLVIQRGWDDLMIPLYDMMSHRNGKWLNTECDSVHSNKNQPIVVRASRDIVAGEEIYTTYNFCEDCESKISGYGTPEILRDYGFVEQYPQRWFFNQYLFFSVDHADEDGTQLKVTWLSQQPTQEDIDLLWKIVERLGAFEEVELAASHAAIPHHELKIIVQYHNALKAAIMAALRDLKVQFDGDDCTASHSCNVDIRYDNLRWRADDIDYSVYTCNTDDSMNFEGFDQLEALYSHYQKIDYVIDPTNDNVCFDISDVIQMCGSYRPFYHEMVVHYTARFLESIQRVLFVGGGDSMLLHEILKYSSLELVVGLELDQFITRMSYKHFGTQPHFDNEKVQWWFGDAAKSLLMLPEDYFGSFDMVLVDLSETVMSFLVTDGLDILQALSLLLKPKGIMVKNELYLEKMSEIFEYSVQIHFPHMPVMCSQCLILGSNGIDFYFQDLTDHKIENLYVKPLSEIKDRYEYFHDYRRNSTSEHLCKEEGAPEMEPLDQKRSPGILMVLEAEDAIMQLGDATELANALEKGLASAGLGVRSTRKLLIDSGVVVAVMLEEGYVMARTWSKHSYCAMDVHLWSSFDKHERAKKALIDAVGSKNPSAYRIVAGGMFGVSTWKEDDIKRGPRIVDTCNHRGEETTRDNAMDAKIANTIFEESMKLIPEREITVVVICGDAREECSTFKLLETHTSLQVVPLHSCVSLASEFEEHALEAMKACERNVASTLGYFVALDKKVRVVLVDPSAPYLFLRVVYKVFKNGRKRIIDRKSFAAMAISFNEAESWRRNFLERFRTEVIYHDVSFRAEVLLMSTDSMVELGIVASGDGAFVQKFKVVVAQIENKTSLVADVRDIKGGPFVEAPNWKPSHFFAPEDYDQHEPLTQWESQQPLGVQAVFQLEAIIAYSKLGLSPQSLLKTLKEMLHEMAATSREDTESMREAQFHEFSGIGLGCVVTGLWQGGYCVVLWDGVSHIDLNIFLYSEDLDLADEFSTRFKSKFPNKFTTALKDVQPRGFGRLVNFKHDIKQFSTPHWARFKD